MLLATLPMKAAVTPDEQAVLAPFQSLLDGIAKRDKDARKATLLPGGMATLIRDGQVLQLPFDSFLGRLEKMSSRPERLEERIYDPLIRIDDDIAVIFTSYDFLIDGKVDHCGSDIVNLIRRDGRWMISGLADNSRKSCQPRAASGPAESKSLSLEDKYGGDGVECFLRELDIQSGIGR